MPRTGPLDGATIETLEALNDLLDPAVARYSGLEAGTERDTLLDDLTHLVAERLRVMPAPEPGTVRPLYKTVITIWRDAPFEGELVDLAFQATEGDAYCSGMTEARIEDPQHDPDWEETEFFARFDDE